jgi:hypothetical protein
VKRNRVRGPAADRYFATRSRLLVAVRRATPAPVTFQEEVMVADTYNGYCVKCKEKRDFEGKVEVSQTGMKMAKGICPVCGTKVNRILGKA